MHVLVSGAGGFLGSALQAALGNAGHTFTTFGTRKIDLPAHCHIDDILSVASYRTMLEQTAPDFIFHLAGTTASDDYAEAYKVNTLWALTILKAVRLYSPHTGVMLLGTAAEYGPQIHNESTQYGYAITEEAPCRPSSLYGISKLAQTFHGLAEKDKQPVIIVRPFNIIGRGMPEKLALGSFVRQAKQLSQAGGVLTTGPLHAVRDFIGVDEVARLLIALSQTPGALGQVINVCSGKATGMRELLETLLSCLPFPAEVSEQAMKNPPSDVSVGSPAKLLALGLSPASTDIKNTIMEMLFGDRTS